MEKHSKTVGEMYSQPKGKKDHPMKKYIGRQMVYRDGVREIVGYSAGSDGSCCLIIDASGIREWSNARLDAPETGGWTNPGPDDVVFKECERYLYVGIVNLTD